MLVFDHNTSPSRFKKKKKKDTQVNISGMTCFPRTYFLWFLIATIPCLASSEASLCGVIYHVLNFIHKGPRSLPREDNFTLLKDMMDYNMYRKTRHTISVNTWNWHHLRNKYSGSTEWQNALQEKNLKILITISIFNQ